MTTRLEPGNRPHTAKRSRAPVDHLVPTHGLQTLADISHWSSHWTHELAYAPSGWVSTDLDTHEKYHASVQFSTPGSDDQMMWVTYGPELKLVCHPPPHMMPVAPRLFLMARAPLREWLSQSTHRETGFAQLMQSEFDRETDLTPGGEWMLLVLIPFSPTPDEQCLGRYTFANREDAKRDTFARQSAWTLIATRMTHANLEPIANAVYQFDVNTPQWWNPDQWGQTPPIVGSSSDLLAVVRLLRQEWAGWHECEPARDQPIHAFRTDEPWWLAWHTDGTLRHTRPVLNTYRHIRLTDPLRRMSRQLRRCRAAGLTPVPLVLTAEEQQAEQHRSTFMQHFIDVLQRLVVTETLPAVGSLPALTQTFWLAPLVSAEHELAAFRLHLMMRRLPTNSHLARCRVVPIFPLDNPGVQHQRSDVRRWLKSMHDNPETDLDCFQQLLIEVQLFLRELINGPSAALVATMNWHQALALDFLRRPESPNRVKRTRIQ